MSIGVHLWLDAFLLGVSYPLSLFLPSNPFPVTAPKAPSSLERFAPFALFTVRLLPDSRPGMIYWFHQMSAARFLTDLFDST